MYHYSETLMIYLLLTHLMRDWFQGQQINEVKVGGVKISAWTAVDLRSPGPNSGHHNYFQVDIGAPPGDDYWVCRGG
jgi:hypothetical protein